jgi:hypothetical protein
MAKLSYISLSKFGLTELYYAKCTYNEFSEGGPANFYQS